MDFITNAYRKNMNQKRLKQAGWLLVLVAVICSFTFWGQRLASEKDYKNVQMVVNYSDVVALANGNQMTQEALSEKLQDRGVSAILYKEASLGDLAHNGQVELLMGGNIKNAAYYTKISKEIPMNEATMYVTVLDKTKESQIERHVLAKVAGAQYYPGEVSVITIPIMVPNGNMEVTSVMTKVEDIGVGFPMEDIEKMASLGFDTVPQLRSWEEPTDKSLKMAIDEVKTLPNLAYLIFNDKEVPAYPEVRTLADCMKDKNGNAEITVGSIEFSNQKGLEKLGILLDKDVIRLHTISNSEMSKFEVDTALDRWMLAARERNMRSLLVRFFDITSPGTALDENLDYLESIQTGLLDAGFHLDQPYEKPESIQANPILLFFVGLGVAAGIMLVLLEMRLPKLGVLAFVLCAVAWFGLSKLDPILARKLMALLSVITFPILSCTLVMKKPKKRNILQSVVALLVMCAISYIGAILMVGLLADVLFMLKLDQFVGVKFAHIVPIVAVPFILYLWNDEKPIARMKAIMSKALDYKWALLGGVVAVAGFIYITRTGNTTAEISTSEAMMRNFLNDVMGVRPRSKEFLIGYPLTLLLFWLGTSRRNWILTIPAVIGQVSLVNTYAHIHTALLISLQRSFNGLVLGIILGVLLLAVVQVGIKLYQRLEEKEGV